MTSTKWETCKLQFRKKNDVKMLVIPIGLVIASCLFYRSKHWHCTHRHKDIFQFHCSWSQWLHNEKGWFLDYRPWQFVAVKEHTCLCEYIGIYTCNTDLSVCMHRFNLQLTWCWKAFKEFCKLCGKEVILKKCTSSYIYWKMRIVCFFKQELLLGQYNKVLW